jgi:hypothetical protein
MRGLQGAVAPGTRRLLRVLLLWLGELPAHSGATFLLRVNILRLETDPFLATVNRYMLLVRIPVDVGSDSVGMWAPKTL